VGSDHLSHIKTGEVAKRLNTDLLDEKLFQVKSIQDQLAKIIKFLNFG